MFVLGMRLKNGKKVKLDMTDKIQNAYEASKNIYDNVLAQEIFSVSCILNYFGMVQTIMI